MSRLAEAPQSVPQADESRTESPLHAQLVRRRQLRGILLLAFAAILFAILRAGIHRVFTTGWWRLW